MSKKTNNVTRLPEARYEVIDISQLPNPMIDPLTTTPLNNDA